MITAPPPRLKAGNAGCFHPPAPPKAQFVTFAISLIRQISVFNLALVQTLLQFVAHVWLGFSLQGLLQPTCYILAAFLLYTTLAACYTRGINSSPKASFESAWLKEEGSSYAQNVRCFITIHFASWV